MEYNLQKYWITVLYTWKEHNIVNWLYFNKIKKKKKEIPFCWILWHRTCAFQHTTHHLHCFFESRKRNEQLSIFSSVPLPLSQMDISCWLPVVSPGGCRAGKEGSEERSQKTVCKIFPGFLFPPLPLVERKNSFLEGQMVYISISI